MRREQFHLKDSVYAVEEPTLGLFFRLKTPPPRIAPLPLATLAPATLPGRLQLAERAAALLQGVPHELVRVDA